MSDDVWANHDQYPKREVVCVCGTVFASHSRFDGSRIKIVSRERCPKCGGDELVESRGDWEPDVIIGTGLVTSPLTAVTSPTVSTLIGNIDNWSLATPYGFYPSASGNIVPTADALTGNFQSGIITSHEDTLRELLKVVRECPCFDEGGPLVEMMDEALAGRRPALLDKLDQLSRAELYGNETE